MKRLLFIITIICFTFSLSSCKKKDFDREKTDKIYCQIVLSNDKKINLKLYYDYAPITVDNFIDLALNKSLEGTIFHRVIANFMVQAGGYRMVDGKLAPAEATKRIKGEFASNGWTKNPLKHQLGVISMARTNDPDSASSQFFLCSATSEYLDGNYAAFGETTDKASNSVIIDLSLMPTYNAGYGFSDFPYDIIIIKEVKLSNSKF